MVLGIDERINGVNLGNWLVLEKWMDPEPFVRTAEDDEIWMHRTHGALWSERNLAEELRRHRDAYITLEDFRVIADHGLNLVRIPIPYFILQFSSENQRKIFFLVIKKHNNDQCDCRKCYINICNIKNRKIDHAEIKEINDIVMNYTVNQVSGRPCKDSDGYDIQRKKTAVQWNSLIHNSQ